VTVAQGFNVVLSAGIVLLTYTVGRLTAGPRAALVAALLWAVFPSQIIWSSLLMSELLFTLACLASLTLFLMVERAASPGKRLVVVVAAGAVIGVALLTRGQALGLCVVFVVWMALLGRPRDRRLAGLFLLTVAATVTPWTVRNARRLDAFIPISSNVGWNAAIGHSAYATGTFWSPIDVGMFGEHYSTPDPAREVAFHRAGLRLAWDWALHHPRAELRLSLAKARILWQHDDDAIAWQELGGAGTLTAWERASLPRIVNGFYYGVLLFAGVGLLAGAARGMSWALLVLLLVLAGTAFHVLFFGANRYHYPLLPLLCIAAAAGLDVVSTTLAAARRGAVPLGGTMSFQVGRWASRIAATPRGRSPRGG
jgi:4-amino-4-deoxy-L-arabinose transferase-like glycosyltransferase